MKPEDLSPLQIDALRELGSVGAGHAATALSQLLDHAVDITVPEVKLVPVSDVPMVFGGPETLVGAVYTRLLGDVSGGMLFIAPRGAMLALVDLLRSRPPGSTKSMNADEEALATHTASILIAAYLAAISRMADLSLLPSPPAFAFDMMGAILEVATMDIGMKADTAILVLTSFVDERAVVDAALFYLPDPDSLEVILGRLGIV
ncbi:MAG: chemotaxis protein CheC [Actinobacteria bacterium]|nr:MAG: chemotaxis protein CheC [Actinomycetota bacterium]